MVTMVQIVPLHNDRYMVTWFYVSLCGMSDFILMPYEIL